MVSMVLDGELIGVGSDGKPSFNALQNRAQPKGDAEIERAAGASPCIFRCFDLLHFAGMNLRKAAYRDRTRYLAQALLPTPHIQRIDPSDNGEALYGASVHAGFEGVVAKRLPSPTSRADARPTGEGEGGAGGGVLHRRLYRRKGQPCRPLQDAKPKPAEVIPRQSRAHAMPSQDEAEAATLLAALEGRDEKALVRSAASASRSPT